MSKTQGNPQSNQMQKDYQGRQNSSTLQTNSSKGSLNQILLQRNKQLQQKVSKLQKQINEQKSKRVSTQSNPNNQSSQQKLINGLQLKYKEDLLKVQGDKQDTINRIRNQVKQQINTIKSELAESYSKEWKQKFDALNQKNSDLQKQNAQLKRIQLDFNKFLADKNQLEILKLRNQQMLAQNKKIADMYINIQKELATNQTKTKEQTHKALQQLKKVNQLLRAQLKKAGDSQNTKYTTKIRSLQTSLNSSLQIIGGISELQKHIQNADIKKTLKTFIIQLNQLRKVNDQVKLRSLGSSFKTIVSQVGSHVKFLQNNIVSQRKQNQAKIKNLQNQKSALVRQKNEIARNLDDSAQKLKISKDDLKKLEEQLKKKSDEKQAEQRKLKDKIAQHQTRIAGLQNLLKQKDSEISISNKKIVQMQTKIDINQKTIKTLSLTTSEKSEKILKLQVQLDKSKTDNQKLQEYIKSLQLQNSKLKGQIATLKKNIELLQKNIKEKENQISRLQQQNLALRAKINSLQSQIKKLNENIIKLKNQQRIQVSNLTTTFNKDKSLLQNQNNNLRVELEEAGSNIRRLRCYEDFCQQINRKFVNELAYHVGTKISLDINDPVSIQNAVKQFKKSYNQLRYFSDSEALDGTQVNFVIDSISNFTQRSIQETKLIYRFDPENKTNFHQYIDGKQNLVVLVKLVNNYVVGGYSGRAVQKVEKESAPKMTNHQGILFSVTRQKVFPVKRKQLKNPQVVSHDDFFFLFGNAEIRIRVFQKKMFSNFSVSASTFDSLGYQKSDFLGENTSEMGLVTYEFYQIKFKS